MSETSVNNDDDDDDVDDEEMMGGDDLDDESDEEKKQNWNKKTCKNKKWSSINMRKKKMNFLYVWYFLKKQ